MGVREFLRSGERDLEFDGLPEKRFRNLAFEI